MASVAPLLRTAPANELAERLRQGDRLALSRMISAVEAGRSDARRELRHLFALGGSAHVVGITGPPGSGKSTLTTALTKAYRAQARTVGVVAVDPSSPFTGGAILGDRIRMMELHDDRGVFVRSMATRGISGGLARSTMDVVAVLDAFGKDVIIVETVGVGQDEVEIARTADSTLVVGVPGLGDDIQAIKAGVLEIADVLVVNKADLPRAQQVVNDLRAMLSLGVLRTPGWVPPIIETVATTGHGTQQLVERIDAHARFLRDSGGWRSRRAENARRQVLGILEDHVRSGFERRVSGEPWESRFRNIAVRAEDPYAVADELVREVAWSDEE